MLTDSGTNAMSDNQLAAMMVSDDAYEQDQPERVDETNLHTQIAAVVVAFAANVALFLAAFTLLSAAEVDLGDLMPGVLAGALAWQIVQHLGGLWAKRVAHQTALYGDVGLVLGLLAVLYLGGRILVLAAEINVVRVRHCGRAASSPRRRRRSGSEGRGRRWSSASRGSSRGCAPGARGVFRKCALCDPNPAHLLRAGESRPGPLGPVGWVGRTRP